MGMKRVQAWVPRIAELAPEAVVVAGVGGGVSPELRAGDVVVASEVRDDIGRTVLPLPRRWWPRYGSRACECISGRW